MAHATATASPIVRLPCAGRKRQLNCLVQSVASNTSARLERAQLQDVGAVTPASRSASHAPIWGFAVPIALSWVPPGMITCATGSRRLHSVWRSFSVRAGTATASAVPWTSRIGAALRK